MSEQKPSPHFSAAASRPLLGDEEGYFHRSTRPLPILLFLLPLAIAYEIGSAVYLSDSETGTVDQIRAERLLHDFFQLFEIGDAAVYLPGIVLVVVLLAWHVLTGDPWRVRPRVLGWMVVESIAWTLPLLVISHIVSRAMGLTGAPAAAAPGVEQLGGLSTGARVTIAIGAGIYEELLFRMVAIALVHLIVVDLMRVRDTTGSIVAVVVAAFAFALYHDAQSASGGVDWPKLVTFLAAGLFFGALYVVRGFGIVVAVHAIYDLVVLVLLGSE